MATRDINDVLHFRRDLSPFLTHLTKGKDGQTPADKLKEIISSKVLLQSGTEISDIRFQYPGNPNDGDFIKFKQRMTGCICFTESPLDEIHCLLGIAYRNVQLSSYGLVFLRDKLRIKHVSPCIYLNNWTDDFDPVIASLASWAESDQATGERLTPLLSTYGCFFPPKGKSKPAGTQDFYWEREWRLPFCHGNLPIEVGDVFCGLCDDAMRDEMEDCFENSFETKLPFIDPLRPATYYAKELVERRKQLKMDHSVV